jgi:hypothetical protein
VAGGTVCAVGSGGGGVVGAGDAVGVVAGGIVGVAGAEDSRTSSSRSDASAVLFVPYRTRTSPPLTKRGSRGKTPDVQTQSPAKALSPTVAHAPA